MKAGKGCTNCSLTRDGLCRNSYGSTLEQKILETLICPFVSCTSGSFGTRLSVRPVDIARLRLHLSDHVRNEGFVLPDQWLRDNDSRVCPGCGFSIVSLLGKCDGCRNDTETVLSAGPEYHGPNVFEVEQIIAKRRFRRKLEYLVVWKGFPESENSWEGSKSLRHCGEAIQAFERSARGACLPFSSPGGAKQSKEAFVPVNLPTHGVADDVELGQCVSLPLSPLLSFGVRSSDETCVGLGECASVLSSLPSSLLSFCESDHTDTPKNTKEKETDSKGYGEETGVEEKKCEIECES